MTTTVSIQRTCTCGRVYVVNPATDARGVSCSNMGSARRQRKDQVDQGGGVMNGQAAWFSEDRVHRYALLRCLDVGRFGEGNDRDINFIMLNPSTADETLNDPTITRCIGFARRWQYTSLIVTNLFAFRATDPADLKRADDPIGAENDDYIRKIATNSAMVVLAWGVHGVYRDRAEQVMRLLEDAGVHPYCLGLTKDGHPKHPLYLRSTTELQPCVTRQGVPA